MNLSLTSINGALPNCLDWRSYDVFPVSCGNGNATASGGKMSLARVTIHFGCFCTRVFDSRGRRLLLFGAVGEEVVDVFFFFGRLVPALLS